MLRVFLTRPPQSDRADPWVRYAADGHVLGHGHDVPARWPADASIEAVLAADQARLVALALPPIPRNRVAAAARYALEDQLATSADEVAIAVADARNGSLITAVAEAATIRAIAVHDRRIRRIVPESALAPHGDGWTWCASAAGDGFVRRADGSTFTVGRRATDADLPAELAAALAQASRVGSAPASVQVTFRCDAPLLARWSQSSGVRFASAAEWRWERVPSATFAAAPDFLAAEERGAAAPPSALRAFRPALLLAALALALHVGALAAQWSSLAFENWRLSRALIDEATAAQLPATTPATAAAAIARHNADARHRAGQRAPADALPLLARAAPSLGTLPPGALRSAHYADATWTLELAKADAESLSRLMRGLGAAGVDAVSAPSAAGARMRLALGATAR